VAHGLCQFCNASVPIQRRRAEAVENARTVAAVLATVTTFAISGLDPYRVTVEVDVRPGLPAFRIVGLGDVAVREARERVRAALLNTGFEFPMRRITANLAPASVRKIGPGFDLALAVGVLCASGQVAVEAPAGQAVFGELGLGGDVRPCKGTLAVAEGAKRCGLTRLVLAPARAREAALVDGLEVAPAASLRDVASILGGAPVPAAPPPLDEPEPLPGPDLSDVRGQAAAVLALEIAAAGAHNVLLEGPPGTGKTMLARRVPSILPPLSAVEALEVTRIHSIAGLHRGASLIKERPFRAPHHTISASGLVGGGAHPAPGEATFAHRGVLFLDELAEFSRSALEALRQPLEDGRVGIVRGQRAMLFPTECMLVAAANPCPCGYAGDSRRCRCGPSELARYRRRLSGPLLDRIDLIVAVEAPSAAELAGPPMTASAAVRDRVLAARRRQEDRLGEGGTNARMTARQLRMLARLSEEAHAHLARHYTATQLSARGYQRAIRVARTVADLGGHDDIRGEDMLTALSFRQVGFTEAAIAA